MGLDARRALVAALLLLTFTAPSLLLVGVTVTGGSLPRTLILAALGGPLAIITLALAYVAREVASEADEPVLVGDRLAERVDMTSEEYRELTDEGPDAGIHDE